MYDKLKELYDEFSDGDFGVKIVKLEEGFEVTVSCDGMDILPSFVITDPEEVKAAKRDTYRFMTEVMGITQ